MQGILKMLKKNDIITQSKIILLHSNLFLMIYFPCISVNGVSGDLSSSAVENLICDIAQKRPLDKENKVYSDSTFKPI